MRALVTKAIEQFRDSGSWEVGLVVTCRQLSDLDDLGLGWHLEADETYKVVNVGEFSIAEIGELTESLEDESVRERIKTHIQLQRDGTATPPRPGARPVTSNGIRLIRHPILWGAFTELRPANQHQFLDGSTDGFAQLAERYLRWFRRKVAKRIPQLEQNEAAAWLSYEFSDQRLSEFGFEWDDEPAVRSAWKGKVLERRQRHWANKYVQRLLRECGEGNQAVAENHRYARAIAKIGDDDSIRQINEFMSGQALSPSVRNWLQKTVKETDKQWKQTTAKWPEPWSHESGSIETVNGSIRLSDGTQLNANLTLWRQQRLGQSDRYSWGGIAENIDGNPNVLNDEGLELVIPGRETSKILCYSSNWGGRGSRMSFSGNTAYPEPKRRISAGETSVLVDKVSKLIREANADISTQAAKSISKQLQPLLARAELPKKGATSAAKEADHFILQDVALVVRNASQHVPPTEIGTFTLWQIATLLLEQHEMTLKLSTRNFEEFARLARSGERESLEELLSWLKAQSIEREIVEPHSEDPSL